MKLPLSRIAQETKGKIVSGTPEIQIDSDPIFDSRKVKPGSLFVAIPGAKHDGHEYLKQAVESGAAALIVSNLNQANKILSSIPKTCGLIQVSDTRRALSTLSAVHFDHPSEKLFTVGITGTKGKTTTNWMIFHLLHRCGLAGLRVGTLGASAPPIIDDQDTLTTPDAYSLQKYFRTALDAGKEAAVIEVSSHALTQARAEDIQFNVGVFTNLSRDHMDYHGDVDEYFLAKARLFELVAKSRNKPKGAVINLFGEYGPRMAEVATKHKLPVITVGEDADAEIRLLDFKQDVKGSTLVADISGSKRTIRYPFIGLHNAENILCALGVCLFACGTVDEALAHIDSIPQVPGRLEAIPAREVGIYVDYAHSPDALQRVLVAMRELLGQSGKQPGKLITVFGCGGDRDRGKRPQMGAIAAELSDTVVITSDNPRTENPQSIIDQIVQGVPKAAVKKMIVQPDRRQAIEQALRKATAGDVVIVAGKGHEQYQIIGTTKLPFSDQETVAALVNQLGL